MEIKVKKHRTISNILYVFKPVTRWKPRYLIHMGLEAVCFVAMPLIASAASSVVVMLLGNKVSLPTLIIAVMAVFLGYGLVSWLHTYYSSWNNMSYIDMRLNCHTFGFTRKGMEISLEQFESNDIRQLREKAGMAIWSNIGGVEDTLRSVEALGANLLGLIVYALIVGGLDLRILLFLLVLSTLSSLVLMYTDVIYYKIKDKLAQQQRIEGYIDRVTDNIQGGKDIRFYSLSAWLIGKYDRAIRQKKKINFTYDLFSFVADGISVLLSAARDLVCYLYLIDQMKQGMTVAEFVFYLGLIGGFAAWIQKVGELLSDLKHDSKAIDDLRCFNELEDEREQKGSIPGNDFGKIEIVFDHVSYRYADAEKLTLKDVSFTLKAGEHLALVGVNGAGKSTLVKLMSGLYLPTEGSIYVNGIDTRQLNRRAYMNHLAAIFQETFVLSYTIGENISFCEEGSNEYDEERIWECLEQAGLAEKIRGMKEGVHTYLGKDIQEDGISLSGGEVQKLLTARALYRNPGCILLDEPTAALDALAEAEIYHSYNTLLRDRTSIFISHRLASTRFCDEILLLQDGVICEQGTHEELLRENGAYAQLFQVQSKYYQEAVAE